MALFALNPAPERPLDLGLSSPFPESRYLQQHLVNRGVRVT